MFITQDEQAESIEECLQIISSWVPDLNPILLMTDNDAAEKMAVRRTWPSVKVLLCDFHTKGDVYKHLRVKVGEKEALNIYMLFKNLVHARVPDLSDPEEADLPIDHFLNKSKKKLLDAVRKSRELTDYFNFYLGFVEVNFYNHD